MYRYISSDCCLFLMDNNIDLQDQWICVITHEIFRS